MPAYQEVIPNLTDGQLSFSIVLQVPKYLSRRNYNIALFGNLTNVTQQGTVIKFSFSPYNECHMWIEECCVVTSTFSDLKKVNHKPRYLAFSEVSLVGCSVPCCVRTRFRLGGQSVNFESHSMNSIFLFIVWLNI